MHIAYISHEYPPDTGKGGIGTYTLQMATIMHQRGHHVEIFTASFERNITEKYRQIHTHRVQIKHLKEFPQIIAPIFAKAHHTKAFDVIECPEIGGEASEIIKQFPKIPLVVRLHTPAVLVTRLQNTYVPLLQKFRFVVGALLRGKFDLGYWSRHDKNQYTDPDFLITQQATIITAPSEAMKQWAVNFWKISPQRIKIIANPYQPSNQLLAVEHNKEHKRITFMGRLNVLKGLVALTRAVPMVLKKHPDWQFRFIGNDEPSHITNLTTKEWMQKQLKHFEQNIEFVDWIDYAEIPTYYAQTDIVVVPSLFESFSYVCAEAMSAGCAVIGSKHSAMRELLDNNKYGLLVNPKNSRQMAKVVLNLIENQELRITLGRKARQRVLQQYNAHKIGSQTEELYLTLAHTNPLKREK